MIQYFGTNRIRQLVQWIKSTFATKSELNGLGGGGTVKSVTAGSGLVGGTITQTGTISLATLGSGGSYGPTSNVSGTQTVKIPYITIDEHGRITNVIERTFTPSSVSVADFSNGGTMMGNLRIGNDTHSPYKIYIGDSDYIWIGEPTIGNSIADDDLEIHAGSINLVADGRGGTNADRKNKVFYNGNEIATKSDIPTDVSSFNNDAGYLTSHQSLSAYAKTSDLTGASTITSGTAYILVTNSSGAIRRISLANLITEILGNDTYITT